MKPCRSESTSELVAQSQLDFSGAIYRSKNRAESPVSRACVPTAENVAVKSVDEFRLQQEAVSFGKAHSLYDRKVFIHILLTSDLAGDAWHIPKDVTALIQEILAVRIEERSTIEITLPACGRGESAVFVFGTSGIVAVRRCGGIKGRSIRTKKRLTRNAVESNAAVVSGYELEELASVAAEAQGLTALVALYAANLPPA